MPTLTEYGITWKYYFCSESGNFSLGGLTLKMYDRENDNWLFFFYPKGKKEYECQVCHHEFSSHGNLKIHMRKHTGE